MVFLAMLATSHDMIQDHFRKRGATGVVATIGDTRRWIMGLSKIESTKAVTDLYLVFFHVKQ